jgi:hypothetical protein
MATAGNGMVLVVMARGARGTKGGSGVPRKSRSNAISKGGGDPKIKIGVIRFNKGYLKKHIFNGLS